MRELFEEGKRLEGPVKRLAKEKMDCVRAKTQWLASSSTVTSKLLDVVHDIHSIHHAPKTILPIWRVIDYADNNDMKCRLNDIKCRLMIYYTA